MAIELQTESDGKLLEMRFTGKLSKQDYEQIGPAVDRAINAHQKVSILVNMRDFHGWEPAAAWEDFKFGVHHYNHVERLAVVGEKTWQKWAAIICKPFTRATVRYFDQPEIQQARDWLLEAPGTPAK